MNLENIKKVGVAGAGTMGSGIAQIFTRSGYETIVFDISEEALDKSKDLIKLYNKTLVEEGFMTENDAELAYNKLSFTSKKEDFSDVDLIVESVLEQIDIKQAFWEEVETITREDTIYATNTSALSINKISENLKIKDRFIGMHFFNPPHLVPLVELVRSDYTSDLVLETLREVVLDIKQVPVTVKKDAPGFIGNRLQLSLFREVLNILEEDIASPEDIDLAIKYGPGFRYAVMGPVEIADHGGLDIWHAVASNLFNEISNVTAPQKVLQDLIDEGNLGVKTGKGFYDYPGDKAEEEIARRDKNYFKLLKHIHNR